MASDRWVSDDVSWTRAAGSRVLRLQTSQHIEFVDLTEEVVDAVRRSGVGQGLVCVQTLHTTTGVVVNEAEPGLLQDMVELLERLVPAGRFYRHDDLARRPGVPPDERANGEAHCRAMLLSASQTLAVQEGRLQLGRWQRVFLVELDGGRLRHVAISVLGAAARTPGPRP
jgi:secondary thiamine-phosphate synthase enzyme